jgi:hypothetical protein
MPEGQTRALVQGGVARAQAPVDAAGRELRFRCELDDATAAEALREPQPRDAQWSSPRALAHGNAAEMRVSVPFADGRYVRFTLERLVRGEGEPRWAPAGVAWARVKNGVASARAPVHHPAAAGGGASAATPQLRFRALVEPAGFTPAASPAPRNARWQAPRLQHGDRAEMVVDVAAPDGVPVRFVLERLERSGGASRWVRAAEAIAPVQGGCARARVPAQPAAALRFRAQTLTSP